ncbi:CRISPR-associated endonuclease Csn1 [Chryseobacterium defluvii]|uniref:CRISPR-associated endonuclease Cas9 n=1 Tax=Chryseobacterium defluvii TaxID=160396 RepID=A0A840KCK4_9FLAO|nr:type II CRISPR RNA-guided endonuclease Cas9 [Chryseobacterium defluvii]MBB4805737.1 CRISPR-associated endonuclease Csn1 [Chryseobacterium defluvii]
MSKRIIGLDLGVSSIGWAVVEEDLKNPENNKIIKLGVRVNPLTTDEQTNFEKGKPITTNAGRTLARSARRNLQRFKLRRKNLLEILIDHKIINRNDILTEVGEHSTFQTQQLRAKSAREKIELSELARVLFLINKKRGYKSSRKVQSDDEGKAIDGMAVAKQLYEGNSTPGEYGYQLLKKGKKQIPDFYRSDLQAELDKVWSFQKQFYLEILTDEFKKELEGKGQRATIATFLNRYKIYTADNKGTKEEKKLQAYEWRSKAISHQLDIKEVAYVITEINNNLNNSSGYLGAISDRSKELYFNDQTIGEYLYVQLQKNPHTRLKNQVFYRQDYLDEFEKIWEAQSKFHSELTLELKDEIRDVVIFYQRKLKSQKGLISICEFENKEIEIQENGKTKRKTVGLKVAPKSSPLFQEFKIWQVLNNIEIKNEEGRRFLDLEEKEMIFDEVNLKGNITAQKALELIGFKEKEVKINFKTIEGNKTNEKLYQAYLKILDLEGYNVFKLLKIKEDKDEAKLSELKVSASEIKAMIKPIFEANTINTSVLDFDPELPNPEYEKQPFYQLWHLLYSYEGDNSASGNEKLYELLEKKFGFKKEHSKILSSIVFSQEYGSLSSKAMRRIFPYIKEHKYSEACFLAGYNHSKNSLTAEDLKNRVLKDKLDILSKNSLRNPVVEKILNQMINLVNEIIKEYGNPDEIRIELARELKKNAEERAEMTKSMNEATLLHQKYAEELKREFGIPKPSKNDIIRYKLYLELAANGFKDLYTDKKIQKENLFTGKYDIDHIIPQSRFFDDSFSNKVLVPRQSNLDKGNFTAYDFIEQGNKEDFGKYLNVIKELYEKKSISKAKYEKLLKKGLEIGDGFVERDLRDSQYIAKKAKEILFGITHSVISTSGSITDKLREDWNLVNTMKELNLEKFRKSGLTEIVRNSKGEEKEIISEWSKRNDHRHHAMDALTVAFTTHNHIQYLNYLNARSNEKHKEHKNIYAIENMITEVIEKKNGSGSRRFISPIKDFRKMAKKHLQEVLISHKAKNKVVTSNINKIKKKGGVIKKTGLTPRGQLHKETVYGTARILQTREEKISAKFDLQTIQKVQNEVYKNALLKRLNENGNDPKKAFSGKNAIQKNPVYYNEEKTGVIPEKIILSWYDTIFTIRKPINADNFKDYKNLEKIIDAGTRKILKSRLDEFDGNAKEAFSDLDKNPIWLNKEKGISIKSVTITGVSNAESLHFKKDHFGNEILDDHNNKIPVDFVSTGNNHHLAVYIKENGELDDDIVSFYEAVERVNQKLPVVNKNYRSGEGYRFLFTLKQNEMFLFLGEDFNPNEIDLYDNGNLEMISKNLFRVQKISKLLYGNSYVREYVFRHHLETSVEDKKELKDITYKSVKSLEGLRNIVKVRLNHLGRIVQAGEY